MFFVKSTIFIIVSHASRLKSHFVHHIFSMFPSFPYLKLKIPFFYGKSPWFFVPILCIMCIGFPCNYGHLVVLQMVLIVISMGYKPFLWGDLVTNITGISGHDCRRQGIQIFGQLVQEGNVHFRRRVESGRSGFLGLPALEMTTVMAIYQL